MHLFVRSAALPVARHEPAVHALHATAVVVSLNVPTRHNVAELEPIGQYFPLPHAVDVAPEQ